MRNKLDDYSQVFHCDIGENSNYIYLYMINFKSFFYFKTKELLVNFNKYVLNKFLSISIRKLITKLE